MGAWSAAGCGFRPGTDARLSMAGGNRANQVKLCGTCPLWI
jgi:hypothetical protein